MGNSIQIVGVTDEAKQKFNLLKAKLRMSSAKLLDELMGKYPSIPATEPAS
jgi:hypothetical protein